ncbi:MAG TPA: NAD-binding protein [Chloroflexia bacterium]|nr:NAD-binding protein [Chloroflexia bacterium]
MKIVILGCGRVGARLAVMMEEDGHDVSVIDADPVALSHLPEDFGGQVVLGTGIDVDVLKSAGIGHADAFAAVTNFDNTNIMACQVSKEIFGVKKVLARIYDPGREGLYHQLGLETICPTTLLSTAAHDILLTPESAGTGPLRVDTTRDVVAVANALAGHNAAFDSDHDHQAPGANAPIVNHEAAPSTVPAPGQPYGVAGGGNGSVNGQQQNGRERRGLFGR